MPLRRAAPAATTAALTTTATAGGCARLPDDVLLAIAARLSGWELSRCVNVCRAWRAWLTGSVASALWIAATRRDFADGASAWLLARCGTLLTPPGALAAFRAATALLRASAPRARASRAARATARERATDGVRAAHNARGADGTPRRLALANSFAALYDPTTVDTYPPRLAWRAVRVAERITWRHNLSPPSSSSSSLAAGLVPTARVARAHGALRAWYLTLARPYALTWHADAPSATPAPLPTRDETLHKRPRRLLLPDALRSPADDAAAAARADYGFYQCLAAALLRGRCRVCNRQTADVHAALRVPMCAHPRCGGAFAAACAAAAAAAYVSPSSGGKQQQQQAARHAWRPRRAAQAAQAKAKAKANAAAVT
jgi:hypothetical protein